MPIRRPRRRRRPVFERLETRRLLANSVYAYPSVYDGHMLYAPRELGDHVEDFSMVGYRGGAVPIPDVAVKATVASPSGGDDTAAIQTAINTVQALTPDNNGFRGAVLLGPGTFRIDGAINITASGVVLRGSGQSQTLLRGSTLTDTSQRTLVNVNGSGTRTTVANTTHTITDKYVPVGAISFTVDSAANLHVGDTVVVHRPSTQQWINDMGMNLLDNPWTPGSKDINMDRTITHIDGNVITIDAPIAQALDAKYTDASQGNNTIYVYTANSRLSNVGVEYLGGVSDFDHSVVTSGDFTDENHPWTFINVDGSINAWVRNVTSQYFAYALVNVTGSSKYVTIQDCQCLDPVSQITGGRRYSFAIDDSSHVLFRDLYTREGRHDFVEGSTVTGPNVFVDDRADNTHADAGPHHRYSTLTLWDNITTGQLNIQDRGNSGTGHGHAGANQVIWNSTATSSTGFIVQSPIGAQNWLIGSIGKTGAGGGVGFHTPGLIDSLGTNVTPRSLYYQQLGERTAYENAVLREVRLGDADSYVAGNPLDTPTVDAAWKSAIQSFTGKTAVGLDVIGAQQQLIPLTFNLNLDPGTFVATASLSLGFKTNGSDPSADRVYVESTGRWYTWAQLGVTLPTAAAGAAVIDLTPLLAALQDGKLNIAISGNAGLDWATLNYTTASTTSPNVITLNPSADAYVQDGTSAATNFGSATTVQTKLDTTNNDRESFLKFDLSGISSAQAITSAVLKLYPTTVGYGNANSFGSGIGAIFNRISNVASDGWSESGINWNNKPAADPFFREFVSYPNEPVTIDVTALVRAAYAGDKAMSLKLASIVNSATGQINFASRENADPALRPQLVIQSFTAITPTADATVRSGSFANTNSGAADDLAIKQDTSTTSDNNREAYLKFDLSQFPVASAGPAAVTLRLMPLIVGANTTPTAATLVPTDTWSEPGLTWNNRPAATTSAGAALPSQATPTKFDATALYLAQTGGDNTLSIKLTGSAVSSGVNQYASRDNADASLRPLLITKNSKPQITAIPDLTGPANTAVSNWLAIWDAETTPGSLVLSATSSNPTLLPVANITFTGNTGDRTLTLTPAANQTGTSTITITVTDNRLATASYTFKYTVAGVPQMIDGDQDASPENDTFRVVRNGSFLDVYRNNPAVPAFHFDYASLTAGLTINALAGNDLVTVDYSAGNPIPAGGLTVDGGIGADVLALVGTSGNDTASLASPNLVSIGGNAVNYSNTEELDLNLGGALDTITGNSTAAITFALNVTGGGTLSTLSALPTFTSLTVAAGTTFNLAGLSQSINSLNGAGAVINNTASTTATLTLGAAGGSGSFSGNLSSGSGGLNLVKTGAGTQTLAGASSYIGSTTVSAGALRITHPNALGSTSGSTTIGGGTETGRIELAGNISLPEPFNLGNRTGSGGGNFAPHILNLSGDNTLAGNLTLQTGGSYWTLQSDAGSLTVSGSLNNANTSNTRTLFLRGAGAGRITGPITQSNVSLTLLSKEDAGTWTLAGTNTYTGGTTINAGTLSFASPTSIPPGASVTVNPAGALRLSFPATIAALTLNGAAHVSLDPSAGPLTLNVLSMPAASRLDLSNNALIYDYPDANPSPLATVRSLLATGLAAGGAAGIVSSAADVAHRIGYALTDAPNAQILLQLALTGDTNLDGVLNADDLARTDRGAAKHLADWLSGDFDYDASITPADYALLYANLYPSSPAPATLSPAPEIVSTLTVAPSPTPTIRAPRTARHRRPVPVKLTIPLPRNNHLTYSIDWNADGEIDQTLPARPTLTLRHSFPTPGLFNVTVHIEDRSITTAILIT